MRATMPAMLTLDKTSLLEFAAARIDGAPVWRDPAKCCAIGWMRDGQIVAAVIFDQFYWPSICGHIATDGSRRWATREFLRAMFDYPFRQLGCARITAPVAAGNAVAVAFLERLGFVREGCLRRALPDGRDRLIYGILKEDCKWI